MEQLLGAATLLEHGEGAVPELLFELVDRRSLLALHVGSVGAHAAQRSVALVELEQRARELDTDGGELDLDLHRGTGRGSERGSGGGRRRPAALVRLLDALGVARLEVLADRHQQSRAQGSVARERNRPADIGHALPVTLLQDTGLAQHLARVLLLIVRQALDRVAQSIGKTRAVVPVLLRGVRRYRYGF